MNIQLKPQALQKNVKRFNLQKDLYSILLPPFIGTPLKPAHPNAKTVLQKIWQLNKSVVLIGFIQMVRRHIH